MGPCAVPWGAQVVTGEFITLTQVIGLWDDIAHGSCVDVESASGELALEIAAAVRSRFPLTCGARVLPGLETRHAYERRARNAPSLQRDSFLTIIGPLPVG